MTALGAGEGRTPRRRAGRGGPPGSGGGTSPSEPPTWAHEPSGGTARSARNGAGVVEVDQGHQLPVPEEDVPAVGVVVHDAPREVALARAPGASRTPPAGLRRPPPGRPGRALRERSALAHEAQEAVHQAPWSDRSAPWGGAYQVRVRRCRRAMVAPSPPSPAAGRAQGRSRRAPQRRGRETAGRPRTRRGGAPSLWVRGRWWGTRAAPGGAAAPALPQHLLGGVIPWRRTRRSPSASSSRTRLHHQQEGVTDRRRGARPSRPGSAAPPPASSLAPACPRQSISSPAVCQPAARCPLPAVRNPAPSGGAQRGGRPVTRRLPTPTCT